jgi:RNA polymerase sigma-70 factor (ECF subfamily)
MDHAQRDALDEMNLATRAARGDHDAFRLIVLAYEARLVAYLAQMLGDGETARDVAQETFLAAYRALPRWRLPEAATGEPMVAHPLSPWLYRIATNRALSLLRSRPAAAVPSGARAPAMPTAPSQLEERTAARDLLRAALGHLTEEDAACLVLHYVAGERYAEIAARLGLTSEAVRKRVSRGLVVLRAAYRALDVEVLA